jgi:hypothetical protein
VSLKKIALALAAVLGLMSMAGCAQDYYGKVLRRMDLRKPTNRQNTS